MRYKVRFYYTQDGEKPLAAFIRDLRAKHPDLHDAIIDGIKKIEDPRRLGMPLTRPVDSVHKIFELRVGRTNIARAFFFFQQGWEIILTSGYVKKRQKIDTGELNQARAYKEDWERRNA